MKKHNKKIRTQKLSRKRLTQQEYLKYEEIGMVDESQDWLELFTPARIHDLFVIMESCSDNQLKTKTIQKELKGVGFETIGEGTNILTMANPIYPGVCFKIALDDCGLADNHNDSVLEEMVNETLKKPRYNHVLAKHPSGMVTVQERKVPIESQDRMDEFRGSIMDALVKLAPEFLIVDLSPNEYHLNYGVERNGDWCFIDASDLYPLANLPNKIRCTKAVGYDEKNRKVIRCGGKLRYNADFSRICCPQCRGEFLNSEIRPKDKEETKMKAMLDGMTQEEREAMRTEQIVRIGGKVRRIVVDTPDTSSTTLPTTDNPETIVVKPRMDETTDQILGRFKKPESTAPTRMGDQEVDMIVADDKDHTVTNIVNEVQAEADIRQTQDEIADELKRSAGVSEDDDDDDVEYPEISEPSKEAVEDMEPISENPDPDDDSDEDEPHMVNAMGEESDDDSEDDEDEDEEDDGVNEANDPSYGLDAEVDPDDDVELNIIYSIVNDDTSPNYGINMRLVGDPIEALDTFALPLFVWINEHTYAQAINAEQMRSLIKPVVESLLEDVSTRG